MTQTQSDSVETVKAPWTGRIEVWPAPGEPPAGSGLVEEAKAALGHVQAVHVARVYLVQSSLSEATLRQVAEQLLADPVTERAVLGVADVSEEAVTVEIHPKPGVMDPAALSTEEAIVEMLALDDKTALSVRTGYRHEIVVEGQARPAWSAVERFAGRHLANPVIEAIHDQPFWPEGFPQGEPYTLELQHVSIRELDDDGLQRLSREGHLFLSLSEMRAIRDYYRRVKREPTDIELETLAQTWSEHCVHKTLKSTVRYTPQGDKDEDPLAIFRDKPGREIHEDGSVTIHNLMRQTVAGATHKLMEKPGLSEWCVSVFEDNAGIVQFDETQGVCIKVETHNHPSAIEPYGGAATGIGGCIRDIIGTGQAAKPIANTDVFCLAHPDRWQEADGADDALQPLPAGVLHPKRILQQVVAGVGDYGNRMGIPTINGAVFFHDDYIGNPLVFAGCVGTIPLDRAFGQPAEGDRIVALGGRTGRDGIHGATFSSAELTGGHAEEFSHAVQIGNPITEKKMLDAILRARDHADGPLFNAITDCGAGGFSSAIGEMGEKVGVDVALDRAPLKYEGLSYTEIWISEAQERMILAVPEARLEALKAICEAEDVELSELGHFGCRDQQTGEPTLVLRYGQTKVGRLEMDFLHNGLPTPTREATWTAPENVSARTGSEANDRLQEIDGEALERSLYQLISHPNIASKHWIIRQYDHEVQGASVTKPLMGPKQDGPSDGAVIRPRFGQDRAIALAGGLAPMLSESGRGDVSTDGDSYWAGLASLDEAVRNAVCVGADPTRIALLDNFCWPGCDKPAQLGALVRAAEACHDGALAYETPFISGKDSLNNQFTTDEGRLITIPQTLLITALGIVPQTRRCLTLDGKAPGNSLLVVGRTTAAMGGSHFRAVGGGEPVGSAAVPRVDLQEGPANARAVAEVIDKGLAVSAHDCSDGGLLVAAAEMGFSGRLGLELDLSAVPADPRLSPGARAFSETPSRYLLEVPADQLKEAEAALQAAGVTFGRIGRFVEGGALRVKQLGELALRTPMESLYTQWRAPLDW